MRKSMRQELARDPHKIHRAIHSKNLKHIGSCKNGCNPLYLNKYIGIIVKQYEQNLEMAK